LRGIRGQCRNHSSIFARGLCEHNSQFRISRLRGLHHFWNVAPEVAACTKKEGRDVHMLRAVLARFLQGLLQGGLHRLQESKADGQFGVAGLHQAANGLKRQSPFGQPGAMGQQDK